MMGNWYDPQGPGEWVKRCCSLLHLGLMVLTLGIVASEFRFNWCESLAGRYLMSTNALRPEIGGIWETGRQTVNARQSLNQIILEKENVQKNVGSADSFDKLLQGLGSGEWVTLDKERFKQLYFSLDKGVRQTLIEPARLVWLLGSSAVDRIFCEGRIQGIKIYFIDSGNRVIQQVDLDTRKMENPAKQEDFSGSLDTLPGFSGRIYPADLFFEAVFKLPPAMVPDLIQDAETLLAEDGTIDRVGIWNTAEGGIIRLGFEFTQLGDRRVVQIKAKEWAVWQLGLILKGEDQ